MENRDKLIHQIFVGKVVEELGYEKTLKLLQDAHAAIPKSTPLTFAERLHLYERCKK